MSLRDKEGKTKNTMEINYQVAWCSYFICREDKDIGLLIILVPKVDFNTFNKSLFVCLD